MFTPGEGDQVPAWPGATAEGDVPDPGPVLRRERRRPAARQRAAPRDPRPTGDVALPRGRLGAVVVARQRVPGRAGASGPRRLRRGQGRHRRRRGAGLRRGRVAARVARRARGACTATTPSTSASPTTSARPSATTPRRRRRSRTSKAPSQPDTTMPPSQVITSPTVNAPARDDEEDRQPGDVLGRADAAAGHRAAEGVPVGALDVAAGADAGAEHPRRERARARWRSRGCCAGRGGRRAGGSARARRPSTGRRRTVSNAGVWMPSTEPMLMTRAGSSGVAAASSSGSSALGEEEDALDVGVHHLVPARSRGTRRAARPTTRRRC